MIGLLGDIHGEYMAIDRALAIPGVDLWLQVGDFGGEGIPYPIIPRRFWFIKGNHEDWPSLAGLEKAPSGPYLENGRVYRLPVGSDGGALMVAAFGGNHSSKYTEMPRDKVPDHRARHFLREEYDGLMETQSKVDLLLTHEAPSPYMIKNKDCGKEMVSELSAMLKPRLHAFGHHHRYGVYDYNGVKTVGLSYGWSDCVLWDERTGEHEWRPLTR